MTTAAKNPASRAIVPSGAHNPGALAVRSAALVQRGLRDLARDSDWLVKKVFSGWSPQLAISSAGAVATLSPLDRQGARRLVLYDIERSVPHMALTVPGEFSGTQEKIRAAFAWRPDARHLVAAWDAWRSELHCFDLHGKMFLGSFAGFAQFPECLAFSETGRYFAAALPAGKSPALRVWDASSGDLFLAAQPLAAIAAPAGMESQAYGDEFGEEGRFRGYGRAAFSPDEQWIAAVAQIEGEWADDVLLLADLPGARNQALFQAQGHITSASWTPDSRQIVYCAAGQAYRLSAAERRAEALPFGAELVACHPTLPLCLCFSSWLKNSVKGALFIADLGRRTVFDQYAAEGVADLRWSADGAKAYAIGHNGLAYIYEPPLD